jgi:hypothetical protein
MRLFLRLVSLCAVQRLGSSAFAFPALAQHRPAALALRGGAGLRMSSSSTGGAHSKDPMHVIQRQLEIYNDRNVDEFMKLFSADCELVDLQVWCCILKHLSSASVINLLSLWGRCVCVCCAKFEPRSTMRRHILSRHSKMNDITSVSEWRGPLDPGPCLCPSPLTPLLHTS